MTHTKTVRDYLYNDDYHHLTTSSELVAYMREHHPELNLSAALHTMILRNQVCKIAFNSQTQYRLTNYGRKIYREQALHNKA